MKKNLFILLFSVTCLASASMVEAKIAPYLKLARGTASAVAAIYFGTNAYSWHKKAEAHEPHSAPATYATARCYVSALAALILGISSVMALEKSFEQLEK